MSKICFLVVCYNRFELTRKCVKDIYGLGFDIDLEIWLFDDGNDNTGIILKNEFPNLNLMLGSGTNYWNRGNVNLFYETFTKSNDFTYYCLINDDLELDTFQLKNWFSNLASLNNEYLYYGKVADYTGKIIYGLRNESGNLVDNSIGQDGLLFLNGNFLLISNSIILKMGFLDSRFLHVFGDTEFGFRALKMNVVIRSVPFVVGRSLLNQEKFNWLKSGNMLDRFKKSFNPLYFNHSDFFYINSKYRNKFIAVLLSFKFIIRLIFGKYVR